MSDLQEHVLIVKLWAADRKIITKRFRNATWKMTDNGGIQIYTRIAMNNVGGYAADNFIIAYGPTAWYSVE